MALLDLSMQDERHAWTQALRAEELTHGAINLRLSYQREGGIAHHCKSSDLWDAAEALQPEVASVKE